MKKYWRDLIELLIVLILSIVLILLIVYSFDEKSKLSDRPIDPDFWGNVADWVMIFVTIFTAVYLIKTFQEQKRTNEIAYSQHRRTIIPRFTLDNGTTPQTVNNDRSITITLIENELYNLNVEFMSEDFVNVNPFIRQNLVPLEPLTLGVNNISEYFIGRVVCLRLNFEDSEQNRYLQMLIKNNYNSFTLTAPQLIRTN